jgi:hypothetical protein
MWIPKPDSPEAGIPAVLTENREEREVVAAVR